MIQFMKDTVKFGILENYRVKTNQAGITAAAGPYCFAINLNNSKAISESFSTLTVDNKFFYIRVRKKGGFRN